jgi:hypothetical protein
LANTTTEKGKMQEAQNNPKPKETDAVPHAGPERPSLQSDRWLLRIVLALSAAFSLTYFGIWAYRLEGINDFFVFWSAARWLVEHGFSLQIYDFDTFLNFQRSLVEQPIGRYRPFAYPPSGLMLFAPLGALGQVLAAILFLGTTLTLYLVVMAWGNWRKPLAMLASPAVLMNVVIGQNGFLSAGLLVGGLHLATRRPLIAGVLIALLTIKPQLGILVPFALIAARQWSCLIAATVATLLFIAVSIAVGGTDIWLAWFELLPHFAQTTASNIDSSARLMISPAAALVTLGVEYKTARLIQIPITLLIILAVFLICRRKGLTPLTIAAICAGATLATPFAYFYDLTIALAAVVIMTEIVMRHGSRNGETVLLVLVWLLPIIAVADFFVTIIAPLTLAALFAAIVRRVYTDGGDAPAGD